MCLSPQHSHEPYEDCHDEDCRGEHCREENSSGKTVVKTVEEGS
jgi:hypothetical protein